MGCMAAPAPIIWQRFRKLQGPGRSGLKPFQMARSRGKEKRNFTALCSETEEDLIRVMKRVRETGLSLTVHCEDQSLIDEALKNVRARKPL